MIRLALIPGDGIGVEVMESAAALMAAVEASLREPHTRTADLGGTASTREVTDFVSARLSRKRTSR